MLLTILTSILFIHVYTGFALEKDVFVIYRNTGPRDDFMNGKDSFKISPSSCNRALPSSGDECEPFQADPSTSHCSCPCPDGRATFVFQKGRWTCLENGRIRVLQDCNQTTHFLNEVINPPSRLWTLNIPDTKLILISNGGQYGWQRCEVHLNSSWYLGCNETRVKSSLYLRKMKELFAFEASASSGHFALKVNGGVQNAHLLRGKIINLGIRCTSPNQLPYHSCLMFKILGQQTCPEPEPELQTSSTVIPQDTTTRTGTPTEIHTTAFPSNNRSRPSLGRENETKGGSPSLGLIVGITVSIVLLIVIIVVSLVHQRRFSRKTKPNESTSNIKDTNQNTIMMNPQINSSVQEDDENGYKRLSNKARAPQISVPSYSVPRGQVSREDGPNTVHMHAYAPSYTVPQRQVAAENSFKSVLKHAPINIPHQHNVAGSGNTHELEPIYNVIEQRIPGSETGIQHGSIPQNTKDLDPAYKVFKQPGFMKDAIRLEQPTYNFVQVLSTAEKNEGPVKRGREPEHFVLEGRYPEERDTISSGGQSASEGQKEPAYHGRAPVYEVLEEPYPRKEERSSHYTISSERQSTLEGQEEAVHHGTAPVYNFLEGPYPKKKRAMAMLMPYSQGGQKH